MFAGVFGMAVEVDLDTVETALTQDFDLLGAETDDSDLHLLTSLGLGGFGTESLYDSGDPLSSQGQKNAEQRLSGLRQKP